MTLDASLSSWSQSLIIESCPITHTTFGWVPAWYGLDIGIWNTANENPTLTTWTTRLSALPTREVVGLMAGSSTERKFTLKETYTPTQKFGKVTGEEAGRTLKSHWPQLPHGRQGSAINFCEKKWVSLRYRARSPAERITRSHRRVYTRVAV